MTVGILLVDFFWSLNLALRRWIRSGLNMVRRVVFAEGDVNGLGGEVGTFRRREAVVENKKTS